MLTTQARDAYPYYQHTDIGYNYRMSNVCAGIGRGQMTVLDAHIAHHKHVQALFDSNIQSAEISTDSLEFKLLCLFLHIIVWKLRLELWQILLQREMR